MNRGTVRLRTNGYTIVETLIFLAVSAALFVSVMLLVNGRQQRMEFSQAVQNFASNLQDIANDVATGYAAYPFGDSKCKTDASRNVVISPSDPTGSQQRCIFVGRVIQFAPTAPAGTDNRQTYRAYTVVGMQRNATNGEVGSLEEAMTVALAPGTGSYAGITDYSQLYDVGAAARIGSTAKVATDGTTSSVGAFGFFTTFPTTQNGLLLGNGHVEVRLVNGTDIDQSSASTVDLIDTHTAASGNLASLGQDSALQICLVSTGSSQHAIVAIGGQNAGQLTVTTSITSGTSCS